MKKEDIKIILYSALVSANTIVWYEVLGTYFFFGLCIAALYFVCLEDRHEKDAR